MSFLMIFLICYPNGWIEIIRPYDIEASLEALVKSSSTREETHDIHWFLHVCYRRTKIEYDFID